MPTSLAEAELSAAKTKQAIDDAQDKVDGLTFPRASSNLVQQTQANLVLAKTELEKASENYKNFQKNRMGIPPRRRRYYA